MPQEILSSTRRNTFLSIKTRQELAKFLGVSLNQFDTYIEELPQWQKYACFTVPKKSGRSRLIHATKYPLKNLQLKLKKELHHVYKPKPSVHGFVCNRSIVTNAKQHVGKKYVFNLDILDFFPSINFGRVRGLFMAQPYTLPEEVARAIAQLCCINNQIPQGSPTSPIISNMICARMDTRLQKLAKQHQCIYTRYADDLSFSTHQTSFPASLATYDSKTNQIQIGHDLTQAIQENGFEINYNKVRLQSNLQRQVVTGLTVNKFPNVNRRFIRHIRAMLHDWETKKLEKAQARFEERDKKYRYQGKSPPIQLVVKGKIEYLGMVRGGDDPLYQRFYRRLGALEPSLVDPSKLARMKGDFEAKEELVHLLLNCPCIRNRDSRNTVIQELSCSSQIEYGTTDNSHVMNIVNTVLNYPEDIDTLLKVVHFYEEDSIPFKELNEAIPNLKQKLVKDQKI